MPKLVGKATTVVEHDGLRIDELVGNVSTNQDTLSVARVTVSEPASEPYLTLQYDEWMHVSKGIVEFHFDADQVLTAKAGESVFIAKGERFRPIFPQADSEYYAMCLPAFKPERCIREETAEESAENGVTERLQQLHQGGSAAPSCDNSPAPPSIQTLYHMCPQAVWEAAVAEKRAYFPATFAEDGNFTHATAVPARLVETANHFYTSSVGNWICLQLDGCVLRDQCGIVTEFEVPKPVGTTDVSASWNEQAWACPHIYGGIPTTVPGVVVQTYAMQRNETDGTFLGIEGLTNK